MNNVIITRVELVVREFGKKPLFSILQQPIMSSKIDKELGKYNNKLVP